MAEETQLSPREAMMKSIIDADLSNKEAEITEGGGQPIPATELLQPGEEVPPLTRPEAVAEEEWEAITDEGRADAVRRAQDAAPNDGTTAAPTGTAAPADETDEARAAREAKEAEDAAAVRAAGETKKRKIKVDGQEREVDEQQIIEAGIRALQKESAVDKRLQEAELARREAERLKESIGAPSPSPKDGSGDPNAGELDAKALAHAIQYGSEDEAAEAIKKLRPTSGLTPEQVAFMVDERAAFREASSWVKSEFKEIFENPDLHTLFKVKEREARAAGDSRPYRELYEDIGNGMRQWLTALTPTTAPIDPFAGNRDAKRQLAPQPSSASARAPAPTEQREPTPAEAVAAIRAMRPRIG